MEICGAHIAQWQHEDPDSERLAKLLAQVTASSDHRHLIEPKMRQMLAAFRGDGDGSMLEISPEVIETFVDYYSYSAPFDIRVLEEMRSRCQSDPGCVADNAAL